MTKQKWFRRSQLQFFYIFVHCFKDQLLPVWRPSAWPLDRAARASSARHRSGLPSETSSTSTLKMNQSILNILIIARYDFWCKKVFRWSFNWGIIFDMKQINRLSICAINGLIFHTHDLNWMKVKCVNYLYSQSPMHTRSFLISLFQSPYGLLSCEIFSSALSLSN